MNQDDNYFNWCAMTSKRRIPKGYRVGMVLTRLETGEVIVLICSCSSKGDMQWKCQLLVCFSRGKNCQVVCNFYDGYLIKCVLQTSCF